jgi:hypothetical protein
LNDNLGLKWLNKKKSMTKLKKFKKSLL